MNVRYFSSFNLLHVHNKYHYVIFLIICLVITTEQQYYQSIDGCVAISSGNCIKLYPNVGCSLLSSYYLSGYTYSVGDVYDITYGWMCSGSDLTSLEGVALPPFTQPHLSFSEVCSKVTWQRVLFNAASMTCSPNAKINLVYGFDNQVYTGNYLIKAPSGTPQFQIPPQVTTFSSIYIFPNCSVNITSLPQFCNLNSNGMCQYIQQPFATRVDDFSIMSNITKSNFLNHKCLNQKSYCFKRTDNNINYLYYSTYYTDGYIPVQQPGYCIQNDTCSPFNQVQLENLGISLNSLGYPNCINDYFNHTIIPQPSPSPEPEDPNSSEDINLPSWLVAVLSIIGAILLLCIIILILRVFCCNAKTIFM